MQPVSVKSPQYRYRNKIGIVGENFALSYLRKQHFRILERNFKARYGEIDIIAQDGHTVVFVEVKTRSSTAYGTPEEAITAKKLHEVILTSQYYLHRHPERASDWRIDVIAILLDPLTYSPSSLRHIPNVTL